MELETQSSKYPADHSPPLEEKIISLFEPDMLLPALYLENFHRKTPVEPERRLMLAVLEDAINCFQANLMAQGKRGKKLFNEAKDWIMEQDNDWMFSFVSICEILRLNPDYVRQGLLQWKEKTLRRNPTRHSRREMAGYGLAATGR